MNERDQSREVSLVTIMVNSDLSPGLLDSLKEIELSYATVSPGRRIFLKQEKGILKLFSRRQPLFEEPTRIISFLICRENEQAAIDFLIRKGELYVPGRGCIFSRDVTLLRANEACAENRAVCPEEGHRMLLKDLVGIACVVHLGEGDGVGRVALDTGTGVPSITYGVGTGLRDKVGLWRITIPAEKEIVNVVVSRHDAAHLMDIMVDAGSLAKPGRGFMYLYPVKMGLLNTRYQVGMMSHVASIEQIVAVVDEIKGGTDWRRRDFSSLHDMGRKRAHIEGLVKLTLICSEERTAKLVAAAMQAGAKGATSHKCRHVSLTGREAQAVAPNREVSEFIGFPEEVPPILDALTAEGAFDDEVTHAQLFQSPVLKALSSQIIEQILSH